MTRVYAALRSRPFRREAIDAMAAEDAPDRLAFGAALAVSGRLGRLLALGWLALRKPPMSVTAVFATAMARALRPSR